MNRGRERGIETLPQFGGGQAGHRRGVGSRCGRAHRVSSLAYRRARMRTPHPDPGAGSVGRGGRFADQCQHRGAGRFGQCVPSRDHRREVGTVASKARFKVRGTAIRRVLLRKPQGVRIPLRPLPKDPAPAAGFFVLSPSPNAQLSVPTPPVAWLPASSPSCGNPIIIPLAGWQGTRSGTEPHLAVHDISPPCATTTGACPLAPPNDLPASVLISFTPYPPAR